MTDYSDYKLCNFYVKALKCPYIQKAIVECPFLKKHVEMCPWLTSHSKEEGNTDVEETSNEQSEEQLPPLSTTVNESGLMVPDPSAFYQSGRRGNQ